MNFNHQHGNYTTANANAAPYNEENLARYSQDGSHHQHNFSRGVGPRQQMTPAYVRQQYVPYSQNAYQLDAEYRHMQPSPSAYSSHPMVVIPQRNPLQANPQASSITSPPTFHQGHYYYHRHSSSSLQHSQQTSQPQTTWPNYNEHYQRPPAQPSTQYSQQPTLDTFSSVSQQQLVTPYPQSMVEIVLPSPSYPERLHPRLQQDSGYLVPSSSSPPNPSTEPIQKSLASPSTPPVDYQQLLLLLAEDYINAARGIGSLVAFYRRSEDLKQYYTLMATGLSCIEASLTQFRLAPQTEALLVLQYCSLIFHETENYDEVDKWLSKAIPLCERNKLLDIKYSMHHLSARALFTTKPRVALRSLDTVILAAEAYKHVPWVYALRFLRVSFCFKLGASHQDLATALQNLKTISELALKEDDAAISLLCAAYEALLHLRSMSASCVEEAQRAVATAKSLQFHHTAKSLSQIWALLDCVEVLCYLMEGNPALAAQKAEQMAPMMDEIRANPKPGDDGLLLIPLESRAHSLTENTCRTFRRIDGKDHLLFKWLPQRDLWAFCFLLNAIAAQARTFADQKADVYLREGLKIIKENLSDVSQSGNDILLSPAPLNMTLERLDWWHNMRWFLQIYMATNATSRSEWTKAQDYLSEAEDCPAAACLNSVSLRAKWETFVRGNILQGTGRTTEALLLFQSPTLQLPASNTYRFHDIETDLCILSVLNSVLITLDQSHPSHSSATLLHELVTPLLINHPNKSLRAAHDLLSSVLNPHDKLIDKKKHFASCLNAARAVNNTQLVSIALTLMCTMFFKDVVGEQAQKSVKSARALADRSGSFLWKGVAAGLQNQTATRHGNNIDAEKAKRDVEKFVQELPDAVKNRFLLE